MRFSVIVPVYNAEKYLEKCVNSIVDQKYDDYEIILIDDESNDRSSELCDRFLNNYPELVRVKHKNNEGVLAARLNGFRLAKGEFCVFVDSDDIVEKELLETIDTLKDFFTELKNVNAEFGYRSATEIFRFISQAHKNDDPAEKMSEEEILDAAILQKLLPKLHGSRKKLEPALKGLWKLCFDSTDKDTVQIARENIDKAIYKESADKIFRMYESVNANGFTSFAEA